MTVSSISRSDFDKLIKLANRPTEPTVPEVSPSEVTALLTKLNTTYNTWPNQEEVRPRTVAIAGPSLNPDLEAGVVHNLDEEDEASLVDVLPAMFLVLVGNLVVVLVGAAILLVFVDGYARNLAIVLILFCFPQLWIFLIMQTYAMSGRVSRRL